jgi:hypothetical protein
MFTDLNLNLFKNLVPAVLKVHPDLKNSALSGVMETRILNFPWHMQMSDCKMHSFGSNGCKGIQKPAKIIYISPYGFWLDLLISIKRIFTGVVFGSSNANGDLRLDLAQGRRITIFCALDGSEAEVLIETDKQSLFHRVCKAVFSCCVNARSA